MPRLKVKEIPIHVTVTASADSCPVDVTTIWVWLHPSFTDAECMGPRSSVLHSEVAGPRSDRCSPLPSSRTFAVLSCQRTAGSSICGPHSETRARGRGATADAVMFSSSCSKTTVLSGHLKTSGVKKTASL